MTTIPTEVVRAATILARTTGVDFEDAVSFAAQSWWEHPDDPSIAWVRTRNRCVEHLRKTRGASQRMRTMRNHASLDAMGADVAPVAVDDPDLARVEDRVTLAGILASLPDDELAALARSYWLGIPLPNNGPARVTQLRALRHARKQAG